MNENQTKNAQKLATVSVFLAAIAELVFAIMFTIELFATKKVNWFIASMVFLFAGATFWFLREWNLLWAHELWLKSRKKKEDRHDR